ncbi:hypothetical protein HNR02_003508 [Amycolatopsis endophytica]|uniref:Uncharacterized protein n=1 Tax=Amycolatopsis endophytica TaxID=860233 RepID=A0A853B5U4_9PSEU|nr:hypothetical protein [Amycolatopsis endophytica]
MEYGDLANSSLAEFLLSSKSLPGAHRDRGAEHAAATSLHEALRLTEPTSTVVRPA